MILLLAVVVLVRPLVANTNAPAQYPPPDLDALYGNVVTVASDGEPLITSGLATGKRSLSFAADGLMHIRYHDGRVGKDTILQPGKEVLVTIKRSLPAERRLFVVIASFSNDISAAKQDVARWRRRGYAAEVWSAGTILDIPGHTIDNHVHRVTVPADDARAAKRVIRRLYERFAVRATVDQELISMPWAELRASIAGVPLDVAAGAIGFSSDGGSITVNAHDGAIGRYRGELFAVVDADGMLAAVNRVGIESMLRGVVPMEIFANAHPEALKAQAVAARTIALAQLARRHSDAPFHVCTTQHCQVYGGVEAEDGRTDLAVRQTRGQALFSGKTLLHAVYSSTCGGHTEDNDIVWGGRADPALRGRPDFDLGVPELAPFAHGLTPAVLPAWVHGHPPTYCALASSANPDRYRWQRRFERADLDALVSAKAAEIGTLKDIRLGPRGPGGTITSVELIGRIGRTQLLHELAIRRFFANLNSATFVLKKEYSAEGELLALIFSGAGWGHGVGMCQLGTIGRAEQGQRSSAILRAYYHGTTIQRLY